MEEHHQQPESPEMKEIVRQYNEELFVGGTDRELAKEILTEDYVRHARDGDQKGRDTFIEEFEASIQPFPEFTIRVKDMIAEGDKVSARWVFAGTNDGPLGNQPPTQRSVEVEGMTMYRFGGNRIAESWSFHDQLAFHKQLSLMGKSVTSD